MRIANIITFILLVIGGINWLLIGIFSFDLVAAIFGSMASAGSRIIYILVGLSALWLIFSALVNRSIRFKVDNE